MRVSCSPLQRLSCLQLFVSCHPQRHCNWRSKVLLSQLHALAWRHANFCFSTLFTHPCACGRQLNNPGAIESVLDSCQGHFLFFLRAALPCSSVGALIVL